MYICLECEDIFSTPKLFTDKHGLDTPPYENNWGCPYCGGNYVNAIRCYMCNKYICGEYIILSDGSVCCEDCYTVKNIEDE